MTSSENDDLKEVQGEANTYEDEINLIDYFIVFWKRKYFILMGSVLPALIVGIVFFLLPRNYKATYVYDVRNDVEFPNDVDSWNLNEKNYNLLISSFYSGGNLNRLIDSLRKNGIEGYAGQISGNNDALSKFVQFEVIPPFLDASKFNVTNPSQLKQIRNIGALLLKLTIIGNPREDIYKISSVIRDNIENVVSLYIVQGQLLTCMMKCNNLLADIENNRFGLGLSLKETNEVLAGLKEVSIRAPISRQDNIVLQFNVGEQSQYLPLDYQIQATESKKVELEGNIRTNQEKYKNYKDLQDLNNRILAELNNKLSSDNYTIEQFKAFLNGLVAGCEEGEMKDFLNSYIRRIDNKIIANKPITEKPEIYPIAKGTVKKSGIVFAVSLMIAVFAAFLSEGLAKNRARLS